MLCEMDERYSEIMATLLDIKSTMKDISHMSVFCTDIETTTSFEPRSSTRARGHVRGGARGAVAP